MRIPFWLETLQRDVNYAVRRLRKSPGFTIIASLSLALGIGANTAAFSVLYAVLLRTLPVQHPERLALVQTKFTGTQFSMPHPAFAFLRDHARSTVDGVIAFRSASVNLTADGTTERLRGMLVSGNYFDVLGVQMAAGTPIQAGDDQVIDTGGPRGVVAVLSYELWSSRFGADPGVIGRTIRLNGRSATVTGVAARGFKGTQVGTLPDVYMPMMFAPEIFDNGNPKWLTNPRSNWLRTIARVKPGFSFDAAQAEMSLAFHQFNEEIVVPLWTTEAQRTRARSGTIVLRAGWTGLLETERSVVPSLYMLMALVALVLLIACVNVASLLVARSERQQRDTAIAFALGATRGRVWQRNLCESLALSAAGVSLGVVFSIWLRDLLVQLVPANQQLDVAIDGQVAAVPMIVGLATTFLLGTVTTLQTARVGILRALKGEDAVARAWLRKSLVVGQLALSVIILVAAALFVQTLNSLRRIDVGFAREQLLIASVAPSNYSPVERKVFYHRLLTEVRAIPGVISAAMAGHEPLGVNTGWTIMTPDATGQSFEQGGATVAFVAPGYFATMGIPILRGRDLTERDEDALRTIVVNENFVRRYLGNRYALGEHVRANGNDLEIVGVVKDSASFSLRDMDNHVIYVTGAGGYGVLHVRAGLPATTLVKAVEAAAHRVDAGVPIYNVRTIGQQLDRFLGSERTFANLSSTFAVLALGLSAIGLYGVIAQAVGRRTREIGIRIALGAKSTQVMGLILREAGLLVALGVAVGVPAAALSVRALASLLYGVEAGDWKSQVFAVTLLGTVGVVAAWLPARRAARVDPLGALRSE